MRRRNAGVRLGRLAGAAELPFGRLDLCIRVAGAQEVVGEVRERLAAGKVLEFGKLLPAELALHPGQAPREGRQGIGIQAAWAT